MQLKYVWMENYKSIGERTKLVVDPKVTCLIGKNESGKSNILDFLSKNTTLYSIPRDIYKQKHRNFDDGTTSKLDYEFELTEHEQLLLDVKEEVVKMNFVYEKETPLINGAISEYFSKIEYTEMLSDLETCVKSGCKNEEIKKQFNIKLLVFKKASSQLDVRYKETLRWLKGIGITAYFIENEDLKLYTSVLEKFTGFYQKPFSILPEIFYYRESTLKDAYNINADFFEKGTGSDEAIKNFINATICGMDMFRKAGNSTNPGEKQDAKEIIQEAVEKEIQDNFNNFYKQEFVKISVSFEGTWLRIFIKTNGKVMQLSERSNGLRWYLSLFIALKANNIKDRSVIFLMDEPGVYLHVDAQKRLLELFDDLSSESNQVIYSTHSPTMLDTRKLYRIRAIENINGSTKIINAVNDCSVTGSSQTETLSLLLNALGMSLNANIGINPDRINVITEGITDADYLNAMADYFNENDFAFISSVGARNIHLVSCILKGWGEDFRILLDGDKAGKDTYRTLIKEYNMEEDRIIKLDTTMLDIEEPNIESLVFYEDYTSCEIEVDEIGKSIDKKIAAQAFANHVFDRKSISKETENNFMRLFGEFRKFIELI